MKVAQQIGMMTLLCGMLIGGSTLATPQKDPEPAPRPTRFRFSESLRKETLTQQVNFNTTESESACGGQVTIDFEMPLKSAEGNSLAPSTPFLLKAGNLEFHSTLEKDPDYHSGANSATLKLTSTTSGKSRTVLATARLRWDRNKLTGKIEAKTPGTIHNIAAEDFLGNLKGVIDGETNVRIEFGNIKAEATIPFHGRLNHIIKGDGSTTGEVITIDLRGELKKP